MQLVSSLSRDQEAVSSESVVVCWMELDSNTRGGLGAVVNRSRSRSTYSILQRGFGWDTGVFDCSRCQLGKWLGGFFLGEKELLRLQAIGES